MAMETLDELMESASLALVAMDYLACESACLAALAVARREARWAYYARVLLPLQEARRQRRMTASEGAIRLGTATKADDPVSWLTDGFVGCVVLTRPYGEADAAALQAAARNRRLHVEVLFADNDCAADRWRVRTFEGSVNAACEVAAPPTGWRDQWLTPQWRDTGSRQPWPTPADWVLDAMEQLGDTALKSVTAPVGSVERLDALACRVEAVPDHEILHQRLAEEARRLDAAGVPNG